MCLCVCVCVCAHAHACKRQHVFLSTEEHVLVWTRVVAGH